MESDSNEVIESHEEISMNEYASDLEEELIGTYSELIIL